MRKLLARSLAARGKTATPDRSMVIGVTSPVGSTGKSTVAISIAMELAAQKKSVALIDAHLGAPNLANNFMISELPAGLAAALRIANQQRFDTDALERLTIQLPKTSVRLLPGAAVLDPSWLSDAGIEELVSAFRASFEYVVVDLPPIEGLVDIKQQLIGGFSKVCDRLLVVALADPIGIFRLLAIESEIARLQVETSLIVNRVRNSVIPGAKREIAVTLSRLSSFEVAAFLPEDGASLDQAIKEAIPVSSLSRTGTFRSAVIAFVRAGLLGTPGQLDTRVAKLG